MPGSFEIHEREAVCKTIFYEIAIKEWLAQANTMKIERFHMTIKKQ